jgi:hypothetical protein
VADQSRQVKHWTEQAAIEVAACFNITNDGMNRWSDDVVEDVRKLIMAEWRESPAYHALRGFAMIGNPSDYTANPRRLDVPFEWCKEAFDALREEENQ